MSIAINITLTILLGMLVPFCGCYFTPSGSAVALILATMLAGVVSSTVIEEYNTTITPYIKLWWMVYIIGIMVNVAIHS